MNDLEKYKENNYVFNEFSMTISLCIGIVAVLFLLWCADLLPNQMLNRCNNKAVEMGHAYWAPSTNGSPVFTWNTPCGE